MTSYLNFGQFFPGTPAPGTPAPVTIPYKREVAILQRALKKLADHVPAAEPGAVDGKVSLKLLSAMKAALEVLSTKEFQQRPQLLSAVTTALKSWAIMLPTLRQHLAETIWRNAQSLTDAIEKYIGERSSERVPVRRPGIPSPIQVGPPPTPMPIPVGPTTLPPQPAPVPEPEPEPEPEPLYPPGTLYYFEPKTQMYMVSLPIGANLGAACMMGLGADATNLPPQPVMERPEPPAQETTKAVVEKASGTTPTWKKWWFWAIVGGAVAAGGTGYFVYRRKQTGRR